MSTRENWTTVSKGWESRADAFRSSTMPVAARMVEALEPQPGDTVLELAAGIGDTGFLAAELVQPGGTLITSDLVPEMLSAAQRRAERLGLRNVRFRQIDPQLPIDLEVASVDGVLCRWGYMLMDDPEAALRETRRVLRPGRRLALAVWTGADENRWSSLPADLLIERGILEPPEPGGPGQFAWARESVIAEHLETAGFVEYEVEAVDFRMRYASAADWWATSRAMGIHLSTAHVPDEREIVAALAAAAADWTAADGALEVPARTWLAVATG